MQKAHELPSALPRMRKALLRTTSSTAITVMSRQLRTFEQGVKLAQQDRRAIQNAGIELGILVVDIDPATRKPTLFITTPQQRAAMAALK